jgi:hypothetical protein
VFVKDALHRNELTDEVEPKGPVDEYLDQDIIDRSPTKNQLGRNNNLLRGLTTAPQPEMYPSSGNLSLGGSSIAVGSP